MPRRDPLKMPDDTLTRPRHYVVTTVYDQPGRKRLVHNYGPYTTRSAAQTVAKAVQRENERDFPNILDCLSVHTTSIFAEPER